jgi:hypothetical protein
MHLVQLGLGIDFYAVRSSGDRPGLSARLGAGRREELRPEKLAHQPELRSPSSERNPKPEGRLPDQGKAALFPVRLEWAFPIRNSGFFRISGIRTSGSMPPSH